MKVWMIVFIVLLVVIQVMGSKYDMFYPGEKVILCKEENTATKYYNVTIEEVLKDGDWLRVHYSDNTDDFEPFEVHIDQIRPPDSSLYRTSLPPKQDPKITDKTYESKQLETKSEIEFSDEDVEQKHKEIFEIGQDVKFKMFKDRKYKIGKVLALHPTRAKPYTWRLSWEWDIIEPIDPRVGEFHGIDNIQKLDFGFQYRILWYLNLLAPLSKDNTFINENESLPIKNINKEESLMVDNMKETTSEKIERKKRERLERYYQYCYSVLKLFPKIYVNFVIYQTHYGLLLNEPTKHIIRFFRQHLSSKPARTTFKIKQLQNFSTMNQNETISFDFLKNIIFTKDDKINLPISIEITFEDGREFTIEPKLSDWELSSLSNVCRVEYKGSDVNLLFHHRKMGKGFFTASVFSYDDHSQSRSERSSLLCFTEEFKDFKSEGKVKSLKTKYMNDLFD